MKSLQAWLGVRDAPGTPEPGPLHELVKALDRLEPSRAQYLARFAYLLGRVARADDHISEQETQTMELLLAEHGELPADQARLVVSLAKATHQMFGHNADFAITQEFTDSSTYDERVALARCLFAVAAGDAHISTVEEAEAHRIANHLRIERPDLTAIRLHHRKTLPGLK
jgi:uncharacterized tellurite resistance protein B-like protein